MNRNKLTFTLGFDFVSSSATQINKQGKAGECKLA